MVLKDIMAISGQPGLFRFIAQGKNAIIVEHLETKKRSSAFSSARVSSLEEISVFTEEEDMKLGKVFDLIHEKENGGAAIDYKADPEKLKVWFEGILPNYNKDKVYVSDIRKIANWYNLLHKLELLIKEEPEKTEEVKITEEPAKTEAPVNEEIPLKKEGTGEKTAGKRKAPAAKTGGPVAGKEGKTKERPSSGRKSISQDNQ